MLAGQEEVEGGRGDDDFGVGVDLGLVELVDDGLDRLDRAVPGKRGGLANYCDGVEGHWEHECLRTS